MNDLSFTFPNLTLVSLVSVSVFGQSFFVGMKEESSGESLGLKRCLHFFQALRLCFLYIDLNLELCDPCVV